MTPCDFELIACKLRGAAMTVAKRMVGSTEDAEDVAGDTMLRLWSLHKQIADSNHAIRLAAVVAHNLSADMLRKQSRGRSIFSHAIPTMQEADSSSSPAACLEWAEDEEWLRKRMEKLPPRELQILQMRQVEQRSHGEIARLLGLTDASVTVMLSRARHKLFDDIKKRNRK